MTIKFELSEKESKVAEAFQAACLEKNPATGGAIGGRFSFTFTPTGIGVACTMTDVVTKDVLNVTDYSDW